MIANSNLNQLRTRAAAFAKEFAKST